MSRWPKEAFVFRDHSGDIFEAVGFMRRWLYGWLINGSENQPPTAIYAWEIVKYFPGHRPVCPLTDAAREMLEVALAGEPRP